MVDTRAVVVEIRDLVIAGWTGRNEDALEHHIAELEALGVERPRTVPCFYRLGANLLTTDGSIDAIGTHSSGEVEFILISLSEGLFVGVGSDHTDRKVEAYDITVSKQVCPKPIASELWPMGELQDHWDSLVLRAWMTCSGERRLYQEGAVTQMLPPEDLISQYRNDHGVLPVGSAMYGGTLPVLGKIVSGEQFEIELHDPVRNRSLRHAYSVRSLPCSD